METVSVGGHRYSDPDVLSLIRVTGSLVDPRSAVVHQARTLNAEYRSFPGSAADAFVRIKMMASLRGLEVSPMDVERQRDEPRDAVLIPTGKARGKTGQVFYNPQRPPGRILFSIAHEIAHTFFPNTTPGARFRSLCGSDSREANELERLCDLAASELVMPFEDFQHEAGDQFCLEKVPQLCRRFGSSYESTVFRLATANPGIAAAGLLRYRHRKSEDRIRFARANQLRFEDFRELAEEMPQPKYRRQSFHSSFSCGELYAVPWNKSFNTESCVYAAGRSREILTSVESLPNRCGEQGLLQAVSAPFQREEAHTEFPDVLFFWSKS
jgi:IrrE N-terminal-like domain